MSDWLGTLQAIAGIIGGIAAILEFIRFVIPDLASRIRKWLPALVKHRIFTHTLFLFVGVVIGFSIASKAPSTLLTALREAIYKTYEWQWAGENWYGRATLANINDKKVITQARVGLIRKTLDDRIVMEGKVLELTQGTFNITSKGIELDLTVNKKNRRTGDILHERIKGALQQRLCFAGRVIYSSEIGTFLGDMILVDYKSDFNVDDWFSNKQDWFKQYIVDR